MTRKELRDIVEALHNRLATENTPQAACRSWNSPCSDCNDCTDNPTVLYGVCADDPCACNDNPYPPGTATA